MVSASTRRLIVTCLGLVASASAAACAGLLGIDPVTFDPYEAGPLDEGSAGDGGADDDASEGSPFDGAIEASTFDAPLPLAACVPCTVSPASDPCGVACDASTGSEFLAVGNGYVFFGSRTRLERAAADGTSRITLASGEIGGIAFHAPTKTIAWTVPSSDKIVLRGGNGDAVDTTFMVPRNGQMHAKHLLLNATQVIYFEGDDVPRAGGQGFACNIASQACERVFLSDSSQEVVATAQANGLDAAVAYIGWRTRSNVGTPNVDAGSVYGASTTSELVAPDPPGSYVVAKKGTGSLEPSAFAVGDDGLLYWSATVGTDTVLYKASLVSGVGNAIALFNAGAQPVASIAAGGGDVYFTEPAPPGSAAQDYKGSIARGSPDGSVLSVRYTNRPNPGRIVQDAIGIYWIDRGNPPQTPALVMRGRR